MGNYFSFPFINKEYQNENNNIFHVEPMVARAPNYLNAVDISTIKTVNKLQKECEKESSMMMMIWNRLNNFYAPSFFPSTSNLVETKSLSVDESCNIYSVTKRNDPRKRKLETEFECQSIGCGFESRNKFVKDCLEFTAQRRHNLRELRKILPENSQTSSVKQTCGSLPRKKFETESNDSHFTFNSKQHQIPPIADYIKRSNDQRFAKSIFQRLDSGIEDSPYPCRASTLINSNRQHLIHSCFEPLSIKPHIQVDLDSVYVTMIRMVDNQSCCVAKDLMNGIDTAQQYKKSISFFVDVRDPLKQKPLCEKYMFSTFTECDSMFSDNYSENCSDDYFDSDDDFIFFEESRTSGKDECGFNLTLNACSHGEFTCSVSASSPVATYVDMCMNTSPSASSSSNLKENCEPTISVKIDIAPSRNNSSADNPEYTGGSECSDSPTTRSHVSTPNRKKPMSFNAGDFANKKVSPDSKTSFCTSKKQKSPKKVCFEKDEDLVVIYHMRHWDFAYREARKGTWELAAVDRCRFWRRVQELELILGPCLRQKLELQNN